MTGIRGVLRLLGGAALTVTVGVAMNQILSDGIFSWHWLYGSLGLAVLALLYAEVAVPPDRERDTARRGRRVYLRQLRAAVQDMETVGITTQSEFVLRMRQVYVDVSLAPQPLHVAAGEPFLGAVPGGESAGSPGRRRSLESVLRDAEQGTAARVLAVLGGPGSGKTTLARNTALALCGRRWRPWKRRLPVLLYLRDHAAALLAEEAPGLGAVAVSAGWLEGKVSASWLERRLHRGGCVVLLDGLDEVADPAERGRVVAWVTRQTDRHPRNVYVVTSRPHGYESNPLPKADVLQVRRFTGEQIEQFLRRWSYATESRARGGTGREVRAAAERDAADLLAWLRAQPALYDLAANPLLLTMIANVHRYRRQLPVSRAELYAEMCDVLLHRRNEARGLADATGLSGPHKQHVVQHLALAMMKARVRDWPLHEAAGAIRLPLRQVRGKVTPELFLDEARKSGLLVEREHGVYGFAHLTLQEYLAAAQLSIPRADTGLLRGNVNDPWWRETILLWAAHNDATSVIVACLASGTVPALALAFDCADQAKIVEPETRDQLDALLTPPRPGQRVDPDRLRLFAGVQATRTLRDTIQLNDTTAVCARPVSRTLYDLFVLDEKAAGHHDPSPEPSHDPSLGPSHDPDSDAVATGMHAGDAERFVTWLNSATGDTAYRLPTPEELADLPTGMDADLTRHTIWAHNGSHAVLHQPPGVPWPYTPTPERVRSTPAFDREDITPYLRFLISLPEQRTRIADWTRVLTAALTRAPEFRGNRRLAPLELVLTLALARELDRALSLDRDLARALAHARDLAHARELDFALALDLTLARARDLAHALAPDHDVTLAFARPRDLARARGLDRALARELDRALAHARALNRDLALDRDLSGALAGARDLVLDHDGDLALDPDRDLALALDRDLHRALDRDPALDRVRALDRDLALALDLARARDLARDCGSHSEALKMALTTFRTLFAIWTPTVSREHASILTSLDGFLTRTGTESLPLGGRAPEDPVSALRLVLDHLRAGHSLASQQLLDQVRLLVNHALDALTTMREGTLTGGAQALACARTALLTATAALRATGQHEKEAQLLHLTWQSLITHQDPTAAQSMPNQVLLIIRTRQ